MNTGFGWSIWHRSATHAWYPARSRPCSAWKSVRTINFPASLRRLKDKRMLLLLDNCEHVIDAAASLAAAILSGASGRQHPGDQQGAARVSWASASTASAPLSSPEPSSKLTVAEAATFPAVQLFVERVSAIVEDFELTDANAPLVVEICRKLDGLPLAIEFAAPRVEALGVQGLG